MASLNDGLTAWWRQVDHSLVFLMVAIVLSVLPHIPRIPGWITLAFMLLVCWRLLQPPAVQQEASISAVLVRIIRPVLASCMFIGIFLSYGSLLGRDAGIALLIALAGMKIAEIQRERDYYITAFLASFLIMTNCFYSQSIITAAYMILCVLAMLFALIDFNDPARMQSYAARIRLAGKLLIQSVPLLIILFVLFPRIPGPLWSLPKDSHSGLTGLSDTMSPGTISNLTLSDEVAFRVEFDGPVPDQSLLYWRGPVLWYTDGLSWNRNRLVLPPAALEVAGEPVEYTVLMEPSDQRWLFALELPIATPATGYFTHDRQLRSRKPIHSRQRYRIESWLDYRLGTASENELNNALQLPLDHHVRTVALGRRWQREGPGTRAVIGKALNLFAQQEFSYTLNPPLLTEDTVDEFLFETRQGFCEHYAAAFVILMRAAGIPARVVTGYQGGSINPIGGYLIVRQRDAHAWAEVWLDGRGWVRVDPTSAVAPARIEAGIQSALPAAIRDVPGVINVGGAARDLWLAMRHRWDAVNNHWNKWVMGYDQGRQHLILKRLGLKKHQWQVLLVGLGMVVLLLMLIAALWLFRQRPVPVDEAKQLYDAFCRKLARCGVMHAATEGPQDFARRIARQRPDLSAVVHDISAVYVAVRYGNRHELSARLRQAVGAFRPKRKPPHKTRAGADGVK